MTDRDALLAAVATRPADDTPRLVFADWLDDNGQPGRAAFVRAQCAAARARPGTAGRAALLDEADDRLAAGEPGWLGEARSYLRDWEYRRGFLHRVRISAADFLRHADDLFRAEPIGRVEFCGEDGWEETDPDAVRAVVAHPAFARVRDCVVVTRFVAVPLGTWLRAIAANPHLTRLRRFGPIGRFDEFRNPRRRDPGEGLTEGALRAFCSAAHLRGLRSLDLSAQRLARDQESSAWLVPAVAGAVFAGRLRQLRVAGCGLTTACAAALAAGPAFGRLRVLDLHGNQLGADGWRQVFHAPNLGGVRSVAVNANRIPALARSPMAARVRDLTVHWEDGDWDTTPADGWRELIDAMPPPRRLAFRIHNPGAAVFRAMREAGWLREVRELDIAGDSQGDVYHNPAPLRHLFRPGVLPRVVRLRFHEASDDRVLAALAEWPGLGRLESLAVTDDYLGRLDIAAFDPRYPPDRLRSLESVTLDTDAAVERFAAMPGLESLTRLGLMFRPADENNPALSAAAVAGLLRSERLSAVTELTVACARCPQIDPAVRAALADPAVLPRLRRLRLHSDDRVPEADLLRLRARFGPRLDAW